MQHCHDQQSAEEEEEEEEDVVVDKAGEDKDKLEMGRATREPGTCLEQFEFPLTEAARLSRSVNQSPHRKQKAWPARRWILRVQHPGASLRCR